MISNSLVATALVAALGGCRGSEAVPPGFQGVLEYDARIVGFEQSGRVERVPAVRGALVEPGTELVKLDDVLARLELDARRAESQVARADLALLRAGSRPEEIAAQAAQSDASGAAAELSRKSAERVRALRASAVLAESEQDKAEAELARATFEHRAMQERLSMLKRGARPQEVDRAEARLAEVNAAIALAEQRIERHTLRALERGEVLDVHVKPGEMAMPGMPAVTLADTAHPYVDVFVPEGEIAGVRVGASARVRTDATPAPLNGAVERVASQTEFTPKFIFSQGERANLVIRVRVRVADPDRRLHAGVPAFVEVQP
jgi:HlyD family secretion protein